MRTCIIIYTYINTYISTCADAYTCIYAHFTLVTHVYTLTLHSCTRTHQLKSQAHMHVHTSIHKQTHRRCIKQTHKIIHLSVCQQTHIHIPKHEHSHAHTQTNIYNYSGNYASTPTHI